MKLGETLDAEQIVYGTFQVEDDGDPEPSPAASTLQLSIRVIHLRELTQSPEDSVTTRLEDLGEAQSRLAWRTLTCGLSVPESPPRRSF